VQRDAKHASHLQADGCFVECINVIHFNLERQLQHRLVDCLLHHLRLRLSLLPVWNHDRDASRHVIDIVLLPAWAEAPRRAGLGYGASCLGIEVWWGVRALVDTTQARNVAVRTSWAQERRR